MGVRGGRNRKEVGEEKGKRRGGREEEEEEEWIIIIFAESFLCVKLCSQCFMY